MNALQLVQQVIYSLAPSQLKWTPDTNPNGVSEGVLTRVVAAPPPPGFFRHDLVNPFALVEPDSGRDHPEHPADLVEELRLSIHLFCGNSGEQAGSAGVVGGNRASLGSSRGRGLLEIEGLVKKQLFNLLGLTARPRVVGSRPPVIPDELAGTVVFRTLEILVTRLPALPDYAPVNRLKGVAGGGTVTLTWAAAPPRYDLVGYTWVRKAGATAPTSPTDGTAAFVASPSATGLVDTPGAGTWSYAVFWAYDVTRDPFSGNGVAPVAPNRWSSQESAQAGLVYLPATFTGAA